MKTTMNIILFICFVLGLLLIVAYGFFDIACSFGLIPPIVFSVGNTSDLVDIRDVLVIAGDVVFAVLICLFIISNAIEKRS